jgi:hypothetical protein
MNTFIVDLKNKPSELAKLTEAIAQKGIDITGFTGATCGDSGTAAIVTNDEPATRRVLTDGQWKFRTIELVEASLAPKPGSLADVTRRLAQAGVNIEAAFPTGMTAGNVQLAFATDNPAKAREALANLVGAGAR